ncbi:type VII secretion protein EssC [Paenibacillus sp. JX-17]|uniref:Type VII secretion protein EssC n=1 Tax=Paenibacillus lacisoli TaxID=3064525 RepID=A0ABT9C8Z3_9BACL|nr:type VII secretion protein EssC [Paenibacillus sp. JX-17]MDO7905722.1 type VII secretion protein EssC [Paenibacillus sp. JX-17]
MKLMYQRSPRIRPVLKKEKLEILRPPAEPSKPTFSLISIIIPVIMTMGTLGFYIYMSRTGKTGNSNYMMFQMVTIFMMMTSYTLPFFVYLSNKKAFNQKKAERDRMYREQLELHREELEAKRTEQLEVLNEIHGTPDDCFQIVKNRSSSLWERSIADDDFLQVRIGKGEVPFYMDIQVPRPDGYEKDPLIAAAEELREDFQTVEDASIPLPLFESKVTGIVGDRDTVLAALRVVITQLTVRHSPDELKLGAFYDQEEQNEWSWMRWLPHVWNDEHEERFLADSSSGVHRLADSLFMLLNRRLQSRKQEGRRKREIPAYVLIMGNSRLLEEEPLLPLALERGEDMDTCTIVLATNKESLPMQCQLIVEVGPDGGVSTFKTSQVELVRQSFRMDTISRDQAESLARYMAPIRLKKASALEIPDVLTLFEMMEIRQPEQEQLIKRWNHRRYPDSLPVPMGVRAGGKKVALNLHDKIERNGHGPHGLIAGTTGSGKSEVIQSIVASLASEFHPHDLVFMLIDYKGGGMSNTFVDLPHVVATITNLDNNMIERAKVSLRAELVRRQKILNDAGNLQHIDEYYSRLRTVPGEPLPHLVIIIDEFAQLKKEHPEFMDELISIAAIGRTLGVHLILATQKPAGVVDDKIWSNSRFRICLRVQSEGDSRDMLKIPNAAWITKPGRGYFQVGSDELFEEMQFAWSGAPFIPDGQVREEFTIAELHMNGRRERLFLETRDSGSTSAEAPKQLRVFIDTVAGAAEQAGIERLAGPWLPPLPENLELDELDQLSADKWSGMVEQTLEVPVGLTDDLLNQQQNVLQMRIDNGHWMIYGMPGTGKTTLLQTLLMSLARNYNPESWNGYILDMGRMLRDYQGLPHVGGVMMLEEEDRIKRLFRFLMQAAAERKEMLAEAGLKTVQAYRRSYAALPQIVVIIDGYLNFRNTYNDENEMLEYLLREGAGMGITFLITANRVTDIFEKFRSNIPNALTFELSDPSDYYYAVGRPSRIPGQLPPGRGIIKGQIPPLEFHAALPASGIDEGVRSDAMRHAISRMRDEWPGAEAPPIKPLPEIVHLNTLLKKDAAARTTTTLRVPIGLMSDDLQPFHMDLREFSHAMIGSPMEGGKTSMLVSWMLSLAYHASPEELELYTIDTRYGGELSKLQGLPHVRGSCSREEELGPLVQRIYDQVAVRRPDDEVPHIVLFIDDADALGKQLNDFTIKDQLASIVRLGRDRKVHVIVTGVPSEFPTFGVDWINDVKASQTGILLGSIDPNDLSFFRIPYSESSAASNGLKVLPPGQGYYVRRKFTRIKTAISFHDEWTALYWIDQIRDRWHVVV